MWTANTSGEGILLYEVDIAHWSLTDMFVISDHLNNISIQEFRGT